MLDKVSTCGNLLHIVSHWEDGGVFCNWKYSKSQDLPKFQFSGGGGYFVTENTQSPKIYLNFNFRGGGGVGGWYSVTENTQSPKIYLNLNLGGGGGIL